MIVTFYSFKGGVGRSMALANVANWLRLQNLKVLAIDWDLEAPGLEGFLLKNAAKREEVRRSPGVVDLIVGYKRRHSALPSQFFVASTSDGASASDEERRALVLAGAMPSLQSLVMEIVPERQRDSNPHPLHFLPAGTREGDAEAAYVDEVQRMDWNEFYSEYDGGVFIQWLRHVAEAAYDIVLIDSRTGLTEVGGVCTRHLADLVVSLCAPNGQNLDGSIHMTRTFYRTALIERRGGRPLRAAIVPARYDNAENAQLFRFQTTFAQRIDSIRDLDPGWRGLDPAMLWELRIPYIPDYAYSEKLCVGAEDGNPDLERQYQRLGEFIASAYLETIDPALWKNIANSPALRALVQDQQHVETSLDTRLEAAFRSMSTPTQDAARDLLLRLVAFTAPDQPVAAERPWEEFPVDEHVHVRTLADAGILTLTFGESAPEASAVATYTAAEPLSVRLTEASSVKEWRRLARWVSKDIEFLYERDRLRSSALAYEKGPSLDLLMGRGQIKRVLGILGGRRGELPEFVQRYLEKSEIQEHRDARERRIRRLSMATAVALIVVVGGATWFFARRRHERSVAANVAVAEAQNLYEDGLSIDSRKKVEEALRLDPASSMALTVRAQLLLVQGKTDSALVDLNRAIEESRVNSLAWRTRSLIHLERGQKDQALADVRVAVALSPQDPEGWFLQGRVLDALARPHEAVTAYQSAMRWKPNFWEALYNLGNVWNTLGARDSAIRAFQSVADSSSDLRLSINALGELAELSAPPPASIIVDERILIHYSRPADENLVQGIRSTLVSASPGVRIDQPVLVTKQSGSDVRYFHPEDLQRASRVQAIVQRALIRNRLSKRLRLTAIDPNRFPNVGVGLVEVWLPALTPFGNVVTLHMDQSFDFDRGTVSTSKIGGDLHFESKGKLTSRAMARASASQCENLRVCAGVKTRKTELRAEVSGTCWCLTTDEGKTFKVSIIDPVNPDTKTVKLRYALVR